MQHLKEHNHQNGNDNEIDLQDLLNILWSEKWVIVSVTALLSVLGVLYSLHIPNIYKSEAILSPVNSSNTISKSLQNYSGLAGLAGIGIPQSANENNSARALKKLESLSFFENKILPNIFLPNLMALISWDIKNSQLNYDENIYDTNTGKWVRKYSYPSKLVPSAQESFKIFKKDNLQIKEDKNTGFITLSIKHKSPFVAQKWAELMVDEVNNYYRQKDKSESEKAISYLNKQIASTKISEVKEAIAKLLEEETKKMTLIEANQSYVFEYIDPPVVMESKFEPKRVLICILFALFGSIISIIYALIKYYLFKVSEEVI